MTAHVAVLMGGWSSEREVSLSSGKACATALRMAGYRVREIDVDRDIAIILAKTHPDICFNALHGPMGEDGNIQGLLNIWVFHTRILVCRHQLLQSTKLEQKNCLRRQA